MVKLIVGKDGWWRGGPSTRGHLTGTWAVGRLALWGGQGWTAFWRNDRGDKPAIGEAPPAAPHVCARSGRPAQLELADYCLGFCWGVHSVRRGGCPRWWRTPP